MITLLDDDDLVLQWYRQAPPAATVVVTFDPINWPLAHRPYGVDFLLNAGVDVISVRKKHEHFFQVLTRESFDALVGPHLAGYRHRLAYGSSLGAYAVLYFCRHGYDTVIASSPRVSAHPRHGTDFWQSRVPFQHAAFDPEQPATSDAVVFYDPHDAQDRHFVEDEVRVGWPRAEFRTVPYAGHPVNEYLAEIGFIAPYVRAVLAGRPPPDIDRSLRRSSGIYHQTLAAACLSHGKLRWGRSLAERAMQLNPKLLLARRTLGEIALAQGHLDEAERWLDGFLREYPLDGVARRAHKRLARLLGRSAATDAAAAAPPGRDGPASVDEGGTAPSRVPRPADSAPAQREPSPRSETAAAGDRAWIAPWLRLLQRWHVTVSREDIVWCYRHLLGREPESEEAILSHSRFFRFRSLVQHIVASPEYSGRTGSPVAPTAAEPPLIPAADFGACIEAFERARPVGHEQQVYIATHRERLHHALNVVARVLPDGGRLLDYSAAGFFRHAVQSLLPGVEQTSVSGVNFELDDYVGRYGESAHDLCLNTEVLEHLLFDPSRMVYSINRMLRPGGHLFLTTPNALAMTSTVKMLTGHGPGLWTQLRPNAPYYERHNREWSPFEVARLLEEHGFEVVQLYTADFYAASRALLSRHTVQCELIRRHSSHDFHGDTLCVLARKRETVAAPVHNAWLYALPQQP